MADEPIYYSSPDPNRYQGNASPGGAGSVGSGPQCREGYHPSGGMNSPCVPDRQTEIADIALQNLKKTSTGSGSGQLATPARISGGGGAPTPMTTGGGGSSWNNSSTTTTTTSRDRVPHADATLASNAALLRAKENQGQIARSALTGLRGVLGERGMLGSGAEAGATEDIAARALSSLSDVNREQQIQNDETARQYGLANYQGDISQRATDIGSDVSMRGQDVTARGQDIGANIAYRGQDVTQRGQDIQATQFGQSQFQSQVQAALEALRQQLY